MPLPLIAAGAALALGNAAGRFISGAKQTSESKKINPVFNQYQRSPFAAQQLALAKQLYGGRMFGAPQLERNIFSNQGNTLDAVNRNATDASQALATAAGVQGQTNEALSDLQIREAQNKYNMLGNLNQAYGVNIGEGDKEYESMLTKYRMDAERKDALRNAGAQNKYGAFSDLSSMAFTLGTGGFFGGGGGGAKMPKIGAPDNSGVSTVPYTRPRVQSGIWDRRTPNFMNRNVIIGG